MTIKELCSKLDRCESCSFYDPCKRLDWEWPYTNLDEHDDMVVTRSIIKTANILLENEKTVVKSYLIQYMALLIMYMLILTR